MARSGANQARFCALAALLAGYVAAPARAQDLPPSLSVTHNQQRDEEMPPTAPTPPAGPTEPSAIELGEQQFLVWGDHVFSSHGKTIVEGHVVVRTTEAAVLADRCEIDEDAKQALFTGHVRSESKDTVVTADRLLLDDQKKEGEFTGTVRVEREDLTLAADTVRMDEDRTWAEASGALTVTGQEVTVTAESVRMTDEFATARFTGPVKATKEDTSVTAQTLVTTDKLATATFDGDVQVTHQDITVRADRLALSDDLKVAEFAGHVALAAPNRTVVGEYVRLDLETEEFVFRAARSTVEPGYFEQGKGPVEDVYVSSPEGSSAGPRGPITVEGGLVTTCDREHPHWSLSGREVTVKPGDELVLVRPRIHLWKWTATLPWTLHVPLDERQQSKLQPEVGHNQVEGFFLKLGYPYDTGDAGNGLLRLNLTQKRGVGLGFDHVFDTGAHQGEVDTFFEPSEGSSSATVREAWKISREFSSSLSSSFQNHSGFAGGSSATWNSDLMLRRTVGDTSTTLGLQHSSASFSGSSSERFSSSLEHSQALGSSADLRLSGSYRRSSFDTEQPADSELDTQLELHGRSPAFGWTLNAQKRFDTDGGSFTGDNSFYSLDRLPEVEIETDGRRLPLLQWGGINVATTLTMGEYRQTPDTLNIGRASLSTRATGAQVNMGDTQLRLDGRFRQSWFTDGSEEYVLGTNAELRSDLPDHWASRVTWSWDSPHGFAPLRLDYAGRQNNLYLELGRTDAGRSRIDLSTGYDLRQAQWRDLSMRAQFTPNEHNRVQAQTSYDLSSATWRPLDLRWSYAAAQRLNLDLASTLNLTQGGVRRLALESDWRVGPKWRLETAATYAPQTGEFEYLDMRVTRDLHCWVGALSYSLSRQEIRMDFGLKAFPFGEEGFGIGSSGQRYDTSYGEYF